MTLDSINFVSIAMMCLIVVALVNVVAHVCMTILAIKDKKRMKERREEFYKRNKHIIKDIDKHFKE